MAKEDIIVIHDFIGQEDIDTFLTYEKYLDTNGLWDVGDSAGDPFSQWSNRFIGASTLVSKNRGLASPYDIEVFNKLVDLKEKIKNEIMNVYKLDVVYADSLNLIKWPHGYIQPVHSDFENYGLEPHVYNWRQVGCVLYLNDNFDGGDIHFPQHGVSIPVKAGMLAFFPGDVHHSHGVQRVLNGTRYTISSFWTEHASHNDVLRKQV